MPANDAPSRSPPGVVGKFFSTLFFLVFAAMGLLFARTMLPSLAHTIDTRQWRTIECQIVQSGVRTADSGDQGSGEFYFEVTYRYSFDGREYTGNRYQPGPAAFSDYGKAARLVAAYPPDKRAVCYVNPTTPSEAVLKRNSLWSLLDILFPLVFVGIGVGGIVFVWRRRSPAAVAAQPISDRAGSAKQRRVMVPLFFAVFLVAGSVALYAIFLRPTYKIVEAMRWPAVPCTVLSSDVKSHSSDDGTTYSVDILYEYSFAGEEHKSNQYKFMGGASSGYEGKRAIVDRHPPGTRTVCYVNPKDPTEAVLERGFTADLWFGLIPLLFVAVGGIGLVYSLRHKVDTLPAALSDRRSAPLSGMEVSHGSVSPATGSLKPRIGRWGKFLGTLGIAAFWNGIVSAFLVGLIDSWRHGHAEWFLALFLTPFVLVGLLFLWGIVYYFLGLFNPRAVLRVKPDGVRLGDEARIEWEFSGRVEVLKRVRIWIEGREEATYRRGTSTATDRSVFARITVQDSSLYQEFRSGAVTVVIPANLMHSFAANHNKILWSVRLKGEIAAWPDVDDEYALVVLPAEVETESQP